MASLLVLVEDLWNRYQQYQQYWMFHRRSFGPIWFFFRR